MWSHAYRVRVGAAISARTFTLVTMVSVVSPVRVLRHAGLGRPAGHADTPLDDQQAMLILPWTTSRPCWDSMLLHAIFRA